MTIYCRLHINQPVSVKRTRNYHKWVSHLIRLYPSQPASSPQLFLWNKYCIPIYRVIQEERSMFWEVIESVIVSNKVHMDICLNLNVERNRAVWISWPESVRFLFAGLDEQQSLQNKCGYTRRIARSQFGCSWSHKETWRSTQTKKKRELHTRFAELTKVGGGIYVYLLWRYNKFVQ